MSRNIIAQLRAQKKQFNTTENKLIDYVIRDTNLAGEATIQELSVGSGVSTATISRFAKKVGFDSFRDFSVALASAPKSATSDFFGEITDEDDTAAIGQKVFAGATNALNATINNLSPDLLDDASHYLIHAKRVGFFGIGLSLIHI